MRPFLLAMPVLILLSICCFSQERPAGFTDQALNLPASFFSRINRKADDLDKNLSKQTESYLSRLAKKEARLRRKMYAKDSVGAKNLFDKNPLDYKALAAKLQSAGAQTTRVPGGFYSPNLDSLTTSLKFLQQNKQMLAGNPAYAAQLNGSLARLTELQNKMQAEEYIRQQVRQRQAQIKSALSQATNLSGLQGAYRGYSTQAFYYGQQMKQYRDELDDPDKLSKRALGLLNQLPAFQDFMKNNSVLASLFGQPSALGSAQALPGLQTRSTLQSMLQSQVVAGGPNAQQMVQQNIQSAQTELKSWKDKVSKLGGGGSDMEMPDGKVNMQHTKSLLQRLEYGANIQTTRSTYAFPTSSDIALSVGYRLNDKSTLGVGAGYLISWGKDISHIRVGGNGASLRSFLETKIKGSIYATAGYELNYQPVSSSLSVPGFHDWTRSGLIGITKKYSINKKLKGNLQLLWDYLSYGQDPRTVPIKFRVGYNF